MKKIIVMLLISLILVNCGGNKRTAEMYRDKQETLRFAKVEKLKLQTVSVETCAKDTNPGLCIAFISMANTLKQADNTNNIPVLKSPMADIAKTLIRVGASAYSGKLANDTIQAGYGAIRDTAIGVSGPDNSINVSGDYRNHSNDDIDNSDNSIADSYNDNSDNSIADSYNDNSVDNSVNNPVSDSNNDNSDNSDNSGGEPDDPIDPTPIDPTPIDPGPTR